MASTWPLGVAEKAKGAEKAGIKGRRGGRGAKLVPGAVFQRTPFHQSVARSCLKNAGNVLFELDGSKNVQLGPGGQTHDPVNDNLAL
jgi:hypothetical protein